MDEKSQNSIKIQAHAEVYQVLHISRTNLAWLMELQYECQKICRHTLSYMYPQVYCTLPWQKRSKRKSE